MAPMLNFTRVTGAVSECIGTLYLLKKEGGGGQNSFFFGPKQASIEGSDLMG